MCRCGVACTSVQSFGRVAVGSDAFDYSYTLDGRVTTELYSHWDECLTDAGRLVTIAVRSQTITDDRGTFADDYRRL